MKTTYVYICANHAPGMHLSLRFHLQASKCMMWAAMASTVAKQTRESSSGKDSSSSSSQSFLVKNLCTLLLFSSLILLVISLVFSERSNLHHPLSIPENLPSSSSSSISDDHEVVYPTNISHLAFGLQGSDQTCHFRKPYMEAWWRPNTTRGYVYLDRSTAGDLLPWSPASPPYRVNDDLSHLISEIRPKSPLMPHGILELFREEQENLRWLIMGDDDTMFFVDNLVDVVSQYDHTKYYYIGYPSEYTLSNHWCSFGQAFGGGGIILSYPLAKALVNDMDRCLRTYSDLSADFMTMRCLADIGIDLTPHKGLHQNDMRGDYSGFLSSHPSQLVLSIHHWDAVDPIFPSKNRAESIQHLMKAANSDQSRLFQQTICHHQKTQWTFSVSWGYSAHVYEQVIGRSWLMMPIETFGAWAGNRNQQPRFMFNTRRVTDDPCLTPHVFYFESIQNVSSSSGEIQTLTVYARQGPRNVPTSACIGSGNRSAEFVTTVHVLSSPVKRPQVERAECCDVVSVESSGKAQVKLCRTVLRFKEGTIIVRVQQFLARFGN